MSDSVVIVFFERGFAVKAAGLDFSEAHDLREELVKTGLYTGVLVGALGSYCALQDLYK